MNSEISLSSVKQISASYLDLKHPQKRLGKEHLGAFGSWLEGEDGRECESADLPWKLSLRFGWFLLSLWSMENVPLGDFFPSPLRLSCSQMRPEEPCLLNEAGDLCNAVIDQFCLSRFLTLCLISSQGDMWKASPSRRHISNCFLFWGYCSLWLLTNQ